ncbi:MAG: hypothetical protein ACR2KQ_07790 [Actinomycetota bacterium]
MLTASDGGRSGKYHVAELGFPGFVQRLGWLDDRHGWALAYEMRPAGKSPCDGSASTRNVILLTRDGGKSYKEVHSCEGTTPDDGELPSVGVASRLQTSVGEMLFYADGTVRSALKITGSRSQPPV